MMEKASNGIIILCVDSINKYEDWRHDMTICTNDNFTCTLLVSSVQNMGLIEDYRVYMIVD